LVVNEVGTGYDRATRSFVTPSLEMQQLPSEYNRLGASATVTAKRAAEAESKAKARAVFDRIENVELGDGERVNSQESQLTHMAEHEQTKMLYRIMRKMDNQSQMAHMRNDFRNNFENQRYFESVTNNPSKSYYNFYPI